MRLLYYLIPIFLFLSCNADYNTDLRGKWQLQKEVSDSKTIRIDTIFYNFDNHVFQIQTKYDAYSYNQLLGRFTQKNDSLFLDFVDFPNISARHYLIKKLSSELLYLKNNQVELQFRKF